MDTPGRPGDVLLGKYRVERVLGQGGMGLVVAARHLELGELFAIKLLLPATLAHPEVVERFMREARAAARLRSEHVARVHDVGRMENGAPYMVMEHLDGSDLKALVRRQGPLPIDDAVAYVLQACDAIAEAHAAGIVHRDLKPANLFLTRRPNGSPSVKVLDFGISKQTGVEDVELTATGATLGSPMYMSPEQIARSKSVDARSDIWAMGVVLYEIVTGRGPFKAPTVLELVALVLQEEPAPPSQLRPDLPSALEAVIVRCLRKRPEERYQSIGELTQALRDAQQQPAAPKALGGTVLMPGRPSAPSFPSLPPPPAPPAPPDAPSAQTAAQGAPVGASTQTAAQGAPVEAPAQTAAPLPLSTVLMAPAAIAMTAPGHATLETTDPAWGRTSAAPPRKERSTAPVVIGAAAGLAAVALGFGLWVALLRTSGGAPTPASPASEMPAETSLAAPDRPAPPAPSAPPPSPSVEPSPTSASAAPESASAPASAPPSAKPQAGGPRVKPSSSPAAPATTAPPAPPATTASTKRPSIW